MALHVCPSCGNQRSRRAGTDCNICYLLADLILEHEQGLHTSVNVSCKACRPAHWAKLKAVGAVDYTQRVMSSEIVLTSMDMHSRRVSPHDRSQKPRDDVRRVQSSSHAQCAHPATRSDRAKCRAQRRAKQ